MKTLGIDELQRCPSSVIRRVLETGEDYLITASGRPTGVRLVPDHRETSRWRSGADLMKIPSESPLGPGGAAAWREDIEDARDARDDEVTDPWEYT